MSHDENEFEDLAAFADDSVTCLYVGDLSRGCSRTDVENEFGKYAEVVHVKIMKHMGTSTPIGYGFVTLATHEGAVRCMEALNGVLLRGRKMRISWAQRKSIAKETKLERVSATLSRERQSSGHLNTKTSIHVSFETKKSNVSVDEERLREVFAVYGDVVDVSIKEIHEDKKYNLTHGFGFVHFHDTEDGITSALLAAKETKGKVIDHVVYTAEPSNNLLKQIPRHLQLLQSTSAGDESKYSDYDFEGPESESHELAAVSFRIPEHFEEDLHQYDTDDLLLSETVTDVEEPVEDGQELVKALLVRGAGLDDKAEIGRLRKAVVRLNNEWQKRTRGPQHAGNRRREEDRHRPLDDRGGAGKGDAAYSKRRLEDQLRDVKNRWKEDIALKDQEWQKRLAEKEAVWKKETQWIEERWSTKCREWCQGYEKLQVELRQQEELREVSIRQVEEIRTQLTKELQKRQREEERSAGLMREKDEVLARLTRAEAELARVRVELLTDGAATSRRQAPTAQATHSLDYAPSDEDSNRAVISAAANLTPPGLFSYQTTAMMPPWLSGVGSGNITSDVGAYRSVAGSGTSGASNSINPTSGTELFDDTISYASLLKAATGLNNASANGGQGQAPPSSLPITTTPITQASHLYQSFQAQLNNESIATNTSSSSSTNPTATSAAVVGGNGGGSASLSAHLKQQQDWNLPYFDNLHRENGWS